MKESVQNLKESNSESVIDFISHLSDACESVRASDILSCNNNLSALQAVYYGLSDKKKIGKTYYSGHSNERGYQLQASQKAVICLRSLC